MARWTAVGCGVVLSIAAPALGEPPAIEVRQVEAPYVVLHSGVWLADGTRLQDALGQLGPGQEVRRAGPPLATRG